MIGSDSITAPLLFVALVLFFALLGVASLFGLISIRFRLSLVGLFVCVLAFLLYRQPAVYDYGIARGDFDFGFPQRYVTTQDDAGPSRFRFSSLALNTAAGTAVWLVLFAVRSFMRGRHSTFSTDEPSARNA
jgi:hypothetical protein